MFKNDIKNYSIIFIVCIFAFFVNNDVIPADLMEARNIATAQEMVKEGNFLTPTLNGELRLAKPPLPTWISAVITFIKPGNLALHRAAAGAVATLMVFFMYLLTLTLSNNRKLSLITALVLTTSFSVTMMGKTATWDIYCHSFMLGGIYYLVRAFQHVGAQWRRFALAGIFMGLSFLSKGPVSFFALLLPFLIAFFAIYKKQSVKGKMLPIINMILICVVISSWWSLYILIFHKEMMLATAETESSAWINRNVRPFYYYWKFAAEAGIWATFWLTALVWTYWKKRMQDKKLYMFSIIWTVAALILLSIVPEKKSRYLLPTLIPAALNVGMYIYYCTQRMTKGEGRLFRLNATIIVAVLTALPVGLYIVFFQKGYIGLPLYLLISILALTIAGTIIYFLYNRREIKVMQTFYGLIAVMILVESLCFIPVSKMFINDNFHSISEVRKIPEVANLPFYHIKDEFLRIELVYEADKIIRPLDINDNENLKELTPFVLVSSAHADEMIKAGNFIFEDIGVYDNNWRKKGEKGYNLDMVRYLTVVK
ncbi:MAG: glycosyltransferase family 39 protein [Culturomica sp.]|jgi:4-amino-4-deoxy-L-arabinose transferase-like glycosyltransferase|nr:glycosyltransferase family 39 protein [Culturomica sp.]